MSFDCANINTAIMNMLQSGSFGETALTGSALGIEGLDSNADVFANTLSRLLQDEDPGFTQVLSEEFDRFKSTDQSALFLNKLAGADPLQFEKLSALVKDLQADTGISFLEKLFSFFKTLSKHLGVGQDLGLADISIGKNGLNAIKQLLIKAGGEPEMVDDLTDDLYQKLEETELSLADVLEGIQPLLEELKENGPADIGLSTFEDILNAGTGEDEDAIDPDTVWMPVSAIPYIKSLLGVLNIEPEMADSLMARITDPDQGVDLNQLIEQLQQFQKTAFISNTELKSSASDQSFVLLLSQLGLKNSVEKPGELTLNELVSAFESLRNSLKEAAPKETLPVADAATPKGSKTTSQNPGNTTVQLLAQVVEDIQVSETAKAGAQVGTATEEAVKSSVKASVLMDFAQVKMKDSSLSGPIAAETVENDALPLMKTLAGRIEKLSEQAALKTGQGSAKAGFQVSGESELAKGIEAVLGKPAKTVLKESADPLQSMGIHTKAGSQVNEFVESSSRPAAKNLPNYVTHQVSRGLVRSINLGINELKIQLKPPELGRLVMTIDQTGNNMRVNIMAENQSARDILISNMNELKAVLSNSGINLESFEVDLGSDFRQSMADARGQADGFGKNNQNRSNGSQENDSSGEQSSESNGGDTDSKEAGSLHYIA